MWQAVPEPWAQPFGENQNLRTKVFTRPYAFRRAPASGPEGTRDVLDAAARMLDPERYLAWIGGTGTELPPILLDWRMYEACGDPAVLYHPRDWVVPRPTSAFDVADVAGHGAALVDQWQVTVLIRTLIPRHREEALDRRHRSALAARERR